MKIKIDRNIETLDLYAVEEEARQLAVGYKKSELFVHRFRNPILLTDNNRIGKLPSLLRDAIYKLHEFPDREVEYDGVSVFWSPIIYPRVWSPSIDTVLFAKAIRKSLIVTGRLKKIKSFLEIGAGSGFLSKYILAKSRSLHSHIKIASLTDINKDALRCAKDNLKELGSMTRIYFKLAKDNGKLNIPGKYDLVIMNPPYIPRPNARKNKPYEGLLLYREMLLNAVKLLNHNGIFMTNFSSLSKSIVKPAFEKLFKLETVEKLKVPLKIPIVTAGLSAGSRRWIGYLNRKKLLIEDKKENSGYRYWHTIEIVEGSLH